MRIGSSSLEEHPAFGRIQKIGIALDAANDHMVQRSRGLPAIASRSGEAGGHLFWFDGA